MRQCTLLLASCAAAAAQDDASAPPSLPLQFRAVLETTAHLVNRSESYPPWRRRIEIEYDYVNKRARAAITEGYEKGRTYVRRYDRKSEYMVKSAEADARCEVRVRDERAQRRILALAPSLTRAPLPNPSSPPTRKTRAARVSRRVHADTRAPARDAPRRRAGR